MLKRHSAKDGSLMENRRHCFNNCPPGDNATFENSPGDALNLEISTASKENTILALHNGTSRTAFIVPAKAKFSGKTAMAMATNSGTKRRRRDGGGGGGG